MNFRIILPLFFRIILLDYKGTAKGLSSQYQLIASEVKEIYNKGERSTEKIRKIFNIKSQPTLYKILHYAQTA